MKIPHFLLADGFLTFVAMGWGLSFVLVKFSLGTVPPVEFIALRFILAALALGVLFFRRWKEATSSEVKAGCVIGIFLFLGFLTQTTGLQYTTPGKSAFITSLYVVLVPFMASLIKKKFVGWLPVTGAIIAFAGLCLLSLPGTDRFSFNRGEIYTLICAFAYALHILAVEHYTQKYNPQILCAVQITFTGLMSLCYSLLFEPVQMPIPRFIWGAILYTGLVSTCFAYIVQNVAQKYTSSTHAALLLGLEGPFTLLFSILLWGERPTAYIYTGCLLIFIAIILIELGPIAGAKKTRTGKYAG